MIESTGYFHPFLVHFPVALILVAAVAEILFVTRRDPAFGSTARFMICAAAWISVPTMVAGFAAAAGEVFTPQQQQAFVIHRIAGIVTPCLAVLAAGLAASARRTGQIWELMLFRILLAAAVISAAIAGLEGGEIVHGPM